MFANTISPDPIRPNIPKVVTAPKTDRRDLIKAIHLPILRPDLPLSIPKVPPIVEEVGLVVFEEISSAQVGEDIEPDSRIRSGTLVLVVEGVNTHRL